MKKFNKFGHTFYYLGSDQDGTNHYLQSASFDCGWYWGFGYVETFTNNKHPEMSRDISSHQHFNGLVFAPRGNGFDNFKKYFVNTPLTDKEIWKLCELMKTFYIINEYSETLHRGGANYTSNPLAETIKNPTEYDRINKVVLPGLFEEVYKILDKQEDAEQ